MGRATAGIAAGYLALWGVIRRAWPDEMSWGRLALGILVLGLAVLLIRRQRRIIGCRREDHDGESPLFLWVHLFDSHLPCEPPERLLHALGESLDQTLVVFISDHGEADNLANRKSAQLLALRAETEDCFESGAITRQEIDAATRRVLEALGYVQ